MFCHGEQRVSLFNGILCDHTKRKRFGNGLPGLAIAFADRSPIFCITSSPPLRDLENNSLQAFLDQVVVAKPITKLAHRVTHGEEIPRLVNHAVRIAVGGAPGIPLVRRRDSCLTRPRSCTHRFPHRCAFYPDLRETHLLGRDHFSARVQASSEHRSRSRSRQAAQVFPTTGHHHWYGHWIV